MNVHYIFPFLVVCVMFLISYFLSEAATGFKYLFGVVIPYLAILTFVAGVTYRMMNWAKSAVPFRIPTTAGQQKSLPWIKPNQFDNPSSKFGVLVRMLLEILVFRSLFRNTKFRMSEDAQSSYEMEKWLWLGALVFHWAFLVTLVRHLRFFTEPVPQALMLLESLDGFMQVMLPGLMLSGVALLAAATYLFLRRIFLPQVKYISLSSDYFPLFLIIGIAASGILMRYVPDLKIDVTAAKELSMGLVTLRPTIPEGVDGIFFVHVFMVSALLAYFPFSKLMHLGGIFLSPTRNMTTNTREARHVNPWNYPVKVHTYDEYEDDFREKMIEAGLPVEKE